MNGNKIFLYLVRRDKKECKLIMVLQGLFVHATRLTNIDLLRLHPEATMELQNIIYDNRMDWEPWIESANNFEDLKQKLTSRGYSQLPFKSNPLHSKSSNNNPHVADARNFAKPSMIRKST